MSYYVRSDIQTQELIEGGILGNAAECFLCGEPMEAFVFCHGCIGSIALHEDCANRLGWDLVKDAAILRLDARKKGRP